MHILAFEEVNAGSTLVTLRNKLSCAGVAAHLKAVNTSTGQQLWHRRLLNGARIHGIVLETDTLATTCLVCFGARQLRFGRLLPRAATDCGERSSALDKLDALLMAPLLEPNASWIMDACFLPSSCTHAVDNRLPLGKGTACSHHHVALGFADNSVELWSFAVQRDETFPGRDGAKCTAEHRNVLPAPAACRPLTLEAQRWRRVRSSIRLLLYAMRLKVDEPHPLRHSSDSALLQDQCAAVIRVASGVPQILAIALMLAYADAFHFKALQGCSGYCHCLAAYLCAGFAVVARCYVVSELSGGPRRDVSATLPTHCCLVPLRRA
jgi:hypothetical protein